jgi:hypothetical protein
MYTQGGCGTSLAPPAVATLGLPNPAAPTQGLWAPGISGLGCPDCQGTCGGMNGLTMDGSGLFGTGIFGTGVTYTDPSTWGVWEWGTVGLAAFAVLSMLDTGRRATQRVTERGRRIKGGFTSPIDGASKKRKKKS